MKNGTIIILFLFYLFVFDASGQGSLLITEKRVVFEGREKQAIINLVNVGNETTTYTVSFMEKRMNEDGIFTTLEADSGQMFASPFLRIYPRTITLAPGEPQTVMLQCRRTADMHAGEYRSHLWFKQVEEQIALGKEEPKVESNQLSFNIKALVGMTIPIIIRTGEVELNVLLDSLKLECWQDTVQYLTFKISRLGNISVHGDLTAEYIPTQGKPLQVGAINGIAVYTSINKRNVAMKLNVTPEINLKEGKIKLSYISRDDAKKKTVFAEAELIL
jgi:hypothetical protein